MSSLRDKLKSYGRKPGGQTPRPAEPARDCARFFDRTDRADYPLPDVLRGELLYLLTGLEMKDTPISGVLFLDTETTGLSGGAGTLAFLTGIGYFEGGSFVVEQNLLRDYPEEGAMLARVGDRLRESSLLVTFNGRTFDMPLLASRFIMQGMRDPHPDIPHVDLLQCARSAWKIRLKRCNLASLEEKVFGLRREDDLPGSQVPRAFFDYLATGEFMVVEPVLRHNVQDIRSLPMLLAELFRLYERPLESPWEQDIYSIGRVLEKRGRPETARKCYRAADRGTMSRLSRLTLADSLRRQREYGQAAEVYGRMIAQGQGGLFPYVERAKLLEHRLGRPEEALSLTRRALLLCGPDQEEQMAALRKRLLRLYGKCEKRRIKSGEGGQNGDHREE